jgi:hypothetical protein
VTARRVLIVLSVVALSLAVAVSVAIARLSPRLRAEVVRALESRMEATVRLDAFEAHVWPSPGVSGRGLTIRHRTRSDLPPLVSIQQFSGDATWLGIFASELNSVRLDGLEVTIPPRRRQDMPALAPSDNSDAGLQSTRDGPDRSRFAIATLTATNARLSILPRNPEKDPRVFDIFSLEIFDLTLLTPSRFTASLTNPVPEGHIETSGSFGPWNRDEPSETPVEGQFTFDADLGTIKGIGGALHASGGFNGPLDHIAVSGTTETPDFRIPKLRAHALPLSTTFSAVVDGTNGDVQLNTVDARLAASRFVAKGFVVGTKGVKGKRVLLDVASHGARMEDVLRLTVRTATPPMSGALTLVTSFDLPQGEADVIDKLRLGGTVSIADARFASDTIQGKVDELSRRARGRPDDGAVVGVPSTVRTNFTMANGAVRLSGLSYTVNGATIDLSGRYALESSALDFSGVVRLDASMSDTQTGFRHFLLKPFDGLFRKGGAGTRLAIRIAGTVEQPKIALDLGRTLKGKN